MKKILLYIVLLSCGLASKAKTDEDSNNYAPQLRKLNELSLYCGDYYIRNTLHLKGVFEMIGASYTRTLYKQFGASIRYMEWNRRWQKSASTINTRLWMCEESSDEVARYNYQPNIGQLEYRVAYAMIDLLGTYNTNFKKISCGLELSGGLSYNFGYNYLLSQYTQSLCDAIALYEFEHTHYWGVVAGASYQYYFWKGRLAAGFHLSDRYYPERSKFEYDYGIKASAHF